jgi:hypothetical protein
MSIPLEIFWSGEHSDNDNDRKEKVAEAIIPSKYFHSVRPSGNRHVLKPMLAFATGKPER